LSAAAEQVRASAEAMLSALADRDHNVARREDLSPTTDARECRRCFFREICDEQPAEAVAAGR
jgi:CRISPR/Cas system-associated exonuclease Cas4 (RecB family)